MGVSKKKKRWLALSVSRCDCSVGIGAPDVADGWNCMGFHPHWGFLYTAKRKANSRGVGNTEECGGSSASMLKGSMEPPGRAVGAVRKNTLGWVSKDKYSLLSADYNLYDLRQDTTKVSLKKKIITGLTIKSFQRRKSKYREQGYLFSWKQIRTWKFQWGQMENSLGKGEGERGQADCSFNSSLSFFCQAGQGMWLKVSSLGV